MIPIIQCCVFQVPPTSYIIQEQLLNHDEDAYTKFLEAEIERWELLVILEEAKADEAAARADAAAAKADAAAARADAAAARAVETAARADAAEAEADAAEAEADAAEAELDALMANSNRWAGA